DLSLIKFKTYLLIKFKTYLRRKRGIKFMSRWMGKLKVLLLLSFVTLVLTACGKENLTALDPKGYGAEKSMDIIILSTVVMTAIFVIVVVIFTIALVKFREKKGKEDYIPKQVEGNHTLE